MARTKSGIMSDCDTTETKTAINEGKSSRGKGRGGETNLEKVADEKKCQTEGKKKRHQEGQRQRKKRGSETLTSDETSNNEGMQ